MVQHILGPSYKTWVETHPGYSIVMIRMQECAPCHRTYPMFKKLASRWEEDPRLQFGCYIIEPLDKDLLRDLKVRSVPTFHVYRQTEKLFETTSYKNLPQLESYIEGLP